MPKVQRIPRFLIFCIQQFVTLIDDASKYLVPLGIIMLHVGAKKWGAGVQIFGFADTEKGNKIRMKTSLFLNLSCFSNQQKSIKCT